MDGKWEELIITFQMAIVIKCKKGGLRLWRI